MNFKSLIIGLGNIGFKYDNSLTNEIVMTHARALKLHPFFDLVGAVDLDKENRNIFEASYHKPTFSSIKQALVKTNPSLIVLATPSSSHADLLDDILEIMVPKFILSEKPLDSNIKKASVMVSKCYQARLPLYVNYMRRSDPGSLQVKKMIAEGVLGQKFKGVVWYSKGLMNNASHFLNLLEFWFGPCSDLVLLGESTVYENSDNDYDFIAKFNNAEVFFISTSENTKSYTSIEIFSSLGRLMYDRGGELISWQGVASHKILFDARQISYEKEWIQRSMQRYQFNVYNEVEKALKGEEYSLCNGNDALNTIVKLEKLATGAKVE